MTWLVAVHGGAGQHSTDTIQSGLVKHALKAACKAGVELMRSQKSESCTLLSLNCVESAIRVMEDEDCLNAGKGSNLTERSTVECDAALMEGQKGYFGSVGAVEGIKNPISLARAVLRNSEQPQPLRRIPPLTIAGPCAQAFAVGHGIETVDPESMITGRAKQTYERWIKRLKEAQAGTVDDRILEEDESIVQDTVGAVACDGIGRMAAGVSSGGILLKPPGRLGEAAVFGAGVWAQSPPNSSRSYACSVSGTGEDIVRFALARRIVEALQRASHEEAHEVLQRELEAFCAQCESLGREPNAGIILTSKEPRLEDNRESDGSDFGSEDSDNANSAMQSEPEESLGAKLHLWCAFTTDSMAIGYASSENTKPKVSILRQQILKSSTNRERSRIFITSLPLGS